MSDRTRSTTEAPASETAGTGPDTSSPFVRETAEGSQELASRPRHPAR